MSLKPVLKLKVDELFLRWLSEPDTQQLLKENLRQIIKGEPIKHPPSSGNSSKSGRPTSPRIRPGSPSTPPCSPPPGKLQSPRSPRKAVAGNKFGNRNNSSNSKITKESKDTFLLEKQREIQERKREREQQLLGAGDVKNKDNEQNKNSNQRTLNINLPRFYFPNGHPIGNDENEQILRKVSEVFKKSEGGKAAKTQMENIMKTCGLPYYWRHLIYSASGGDKLGYITFSSFSTMWKRVCQQCHDEAARFVKLIAKPKTNYIVAEDLVPLIQDIVDHHVGLQFLQDAPEFHSRYVHTVIARIFYCVNRSWTGRITVPELRKSNFLQTLAMLEEEEDVNQILDYFSYEHFYVIYCKFWELDTDHDLFISKEDLARHNDHAISSRMIDRIFSGAVTRGRAQKEGKMSYTEFVWFLISEEDKKHPTSIEYWFRCMDIDGDGVISYYEMEYFYAEQLQKMEALGIETLPFEDCLCQMLDLVKPRDPKRITLSDLKCCKLTPIFFDTFFNLDKFLEHEQRDPFANSRDQDDGVEPSDWEKYAAEEYEILVAEEGANDNQEDINYEDDFEPDEDELIALEDPPKKKGGAASKE
ncbi:unnamed protein product [Owenia fusiformis]|uniref:EF-hand domain-containing protein n=1 Tax=Owenia fusiformis TaxID=6347 RepID=A0A8S4NMK5_OWEFU|nr:unnamed protein product [Owenia fusiformis]